MEIFKPMPYPILVEKWQKKPTVIEAVQLSPSNVHRVANWCGGRVIEESKPSDRTDVYIALEIPTLEGVMRAQVTDLTGQYFGGDFVIRGVRGEFYPCKPDIFLETYEKFVLDFHSE